MKRKRKVVTNKIAIVGDIHTNVDRLRQFIKDHPEVDAIYSVGDLAVFASKISMYQDKKTVKHTGDIVSKYIEQFANDSFEKLEKPLYIIKGNHDDYMNMYTSIFSSKNIFYFGQGEVKISGNMSIAGLGGIYSSVKSYTSAKSFSGREKRFFTVNEINELKKHNPVDILLTHQAIAGVLPTIPNKDTKGKVYQWKDEGCKELNTLLVHLLPKYYLCGHHHKNFETNVGATHVIGLGNFGKNGESFRIFDTTTKEVIK
jgi:Icc-related predicted phosphoesterase